MTISNTNPYLQINEKNLKMTQFMNLIETI